MSSPAPDEALMAHALRLAARGLYTTDPNPRVGCVIAQGGLVVGEGWHEWAGAAHAEVRALADAGAHAQGADVYLTLEPCCHHGRTPPCTDALIDAGVKRVFCALQDPNPAVAGQGMAALEAAGIEVIRVERAAAEARGLNRGFVRRMVAGRPWVRVKTAMTLDGRTALANGESRWITSEAARADVHRWRARASCLLTGIGTVLADDPALNVRLADPAVAVQPPWLAVVDTDLRTPQTSRILDVHDCVRIFTAAAPASPAAKALAARGAEIVQLPPGPGGVDLVALCDALGTYEANEVHVEAGATLCGALIDADRLDELVIYMAPSLLGDRGRGAFTFRPPPAIADRVQLHIEEIRQVGEDLRIRAYPLVNRE